MIYNFECPAGAVLSTDLGAIGCVQGGAYVAAVSITPAVGVVNNSAIDSLSVDDMNALLSAALVVIALAWGFKMIGRLMVRG